MVDQTPGTDARLDPESAEWSQALAGTGRLREEALATLRRAVDNELTQRQREVFVAIVVNQVPLDALVVELAPSRNSIYLPPAATPFTRGCSRPGVSYGPLSPLTASWATKARAARGTSSSVLGLNAGQPDGVLAVVGAGGWTGRAATHYAPSQACGRLLTATS